MTAPDPVAVAVESTLTPPLAEAAAEVLAYARAMAARASNGWDRTFVGPAPEFTPLRLRSLRVLAEHAYATGEPCDGERCESGGAAHCHRCSEVEADKLLAERDQLRAALTELLGSFPGAYYGNGRWHSRSQWIETAKLDGWRALVTREPAGHTAPDGSIGP